MKIIGSIPTATLFRLKTNKKYKKKQAKVSKKRVKNNSFFIKIELAYDCKQMLIFS